MVFDAVSVATIAASTVFLLGAWRLRGAVAVRLGLIVLAALFIRADAAYQRSLHVWDESYHALVARNLIEQPLKPVLYRQPALAYDHRDWTANHVWMHKPPGALWLMAASMAALGVNELAMRAPGVLLSTLSVVLTFLIGRALFSDRVALLAAAFHGVNGFLVALAAGRRVADHVDTALIFFVELAILAAVYFGRRRQRRWIGLAGGAVGAAFLVKSLPSLVVLPVAFMAFAPVGRWPTRIRLVSVIAGLGILVALPWTVFAWSAYPAESAWSFRYTLLHVTRVVEGQATAWWTYFADMPRFFGELVLLPITIAIVMAARSREPHSLRTVLVWAAVPYLVFSMMATRMPAYVMIAAPALFLLQAVVWIELRDRLVHTSGAVLRAGLAVLLLLLALLPAPHLLEPAGPFEARDRTPRGPEQLRSLHARLGLSDAVIFNIPRPIDAMFYSPYTAYDRMPSEREVQALNARGLPVVIYQPGEERVVVPPHWNVIVLAEDTATR